MRRYAATQPGIWSRVGPLLRVLEAASSSDTSLIDLREQIAAERRHGPRAGLGKMFEERGVLRSGLAPSVLWLVGTSEFEVRLANHAVVDEKVATW